MKFTFPFFRRSVPAQRAEPNLPGAERADVLDLTAKAGYESRLEDSQPLHQLGVLDLTASIQRGVEAFPQVNYVAALTMDSADLVKIGDGMCGSENGGVGLGSTFGMIAPGVAAWYTSQGFIGHQMCAIIAQQWLVGKACAMPAEDALRNGWTTDFKGVDEASKVEELTNKLQKLDAKMSLDTVMENAAKFANVFGIRILIPIIESSDPEYYKKQFNIDGVTVESFRGWSQIDPQWIYPMLDSVGASDPSSPHFYEPTYWVAGGKTYHRSHLVILRTEQPADVLKPTYLFGGIPLTQRIAERVYAAERTANEAPLLAMSKRTTVMKVDLAKAKMKLNSFIARIQEWITYRDNYQVKVLGKDEVLEESDTSLADLDTVIMTQFQLVAAIARVPATKLLGTSPKGFNSTGDHEIKSYHEYLESIQSTWFDRFLERHYLLMSKSYFDGIEIKHAWEPVDSVGAEAAATIQKTKAETGKTLIEAGVISPDEERTRLKVDRDADYTLAEDSTAPELPDPQADESAPSSPQGFEQQTGDIADDEGVEAATLLTTTLLATAVTESDAAVLPAVNDAAVEKAVSRLVEALSVSAKRTAVTPQVLPTVERSVEPTVSLPHHLTI